MIRLLLAALFSDFGLWSLGGLMVVAVVALLVARFIRPFLPKWLDWLPDWTPIAIAAVFAIFLTSGWLYRSGEAACQTRVDAAVAAMQIKDQATIAGLRRELDRQQDENDAANAALADLEAMLKQRPGRAACAIMKGDIDAIEAP
jgi:hypothetical protein